MQEMAIPKKSRILTTQNCRKYGIKDTSGLSYSLCTINTC